MPKRKRSREEDTERLKRKIQKLQKKLNTRLQSDDSSTTSDLDEVPPLEGYGADTPVLHPSDWVLEIPVTNDITDDQILAHDSQSILVQPEQGELSPQPGTSTAPPENTSNEGNIVLDNDILEILGEDPSGTEKFGPEIRNELANRLKHYATEGITKEQRKELLSKYVTPSNCISIDAPKLNLEIKAALTEPAIKRDKGIELKQKQMASAIACLSDVINTHLVASTKDNAFLQKLMDLNRLLCDLQHADSVTRRNFVLFSLKNEMKEHLKNTKIDTSLFGEDLAETLKLAKAVNKSGVELKAVPVNKQPTSKQFKPSSMKNLNGKAPPQTRRTPGQAPPYQSAPRSRDPAAPHQPRSYYHQPPPAHSSRPSQQNTHRRRH